MIEILETNDFSLLAELNEEIQTFHHSTYPDIFKPFDKAAVDPFFREKLRGKNTRAYVAKDGETAIGYVLLFIMEFPENPFQYSRTYLLIDQILVKKQYQSKGIGRLLLNATISFAQSNNIHRIELNHWSQNKSARKFFGKSGFEYYNEKMWRNIM